MSGPHLGRSKLILVALCSVSATFGGRSWSCRGCGGLFYEYNNKMELTGQGLCGGTGWTIQGVSESA